MKLISSPSLRKRQDNLPLLLSFFIPFAICCLAFTVVSLLLSQRGLYPFGNDMILAHDGWHQYYPFFSDFRDRLVNGGSLEYTWNIGMGTGYASLFAYYLSSPLNLLCLLVPSDYLPELYAFLTILKISFSGLFFAIYLRTVYRKNDRTIPVFALMYAFCAWVCGYYWNTMWLDAFALLPLFVAGTVSLLRDGRFRLYIAALALTLWCNYYIGYICCIFILLCFIGYCIVCWNGFKNFLRRFLRIGICTLIGVGLTAVLLIPTLKALQTTYSAKSKEVHMLAMNIVSGVYGVPEEGQSIFGLLKSETLPNFLKASRKVLSGLMTNPSITSMEGLPNIFCGFSTLILAIYYFFCKKIKLREKLFNLILLLFLMASFILRGLDYAWHGFHFPNMLPYRFSFLFSFVLIGMAYRAYHLIDGFKKWHLAILIPLAALFIVNLIGDEKTGEIRFALNIAVLLAMAVFFLLRAPNRLRRTLSTLLLCATVTAEMLICFGQGLSTVGFTTREDYPKQSPGVQALLEYAKINTDELFWRTEVSKTQTLNDGALNNFHGVSIFTSSANVNFNRFTRSLGLSSWPGSNRFSYYEGSPFTNTMCSIRYILDRDGNHLDPRFNTLVATSDEVNLLECSGYVSLGFMADQNLEQFVTAETSYNPFPEQETMFYLATGVEEPLYSTLQYDRLQCSDHCTLESNGGGGTQYTYSTQDASERSSFSICYTAVGSGLYCATTKAVDAKEVHIYRNGELVCSRNIKARSLFSLGEFDAGDEIKLTYFVDAGKEGIISLDVRLHNDAVYRQGLEALADEPWVLTEFSVTHVAGTIEAKEDGLFYTSIPYEPGWTATVDGTPITLAETYDPSVDAVKLTDAVIAFPLSAGTHTIELNYSTPGLGLGALISGISLLALGLLLWLCRGKHTMLPDRAPEEIESDAEWKALAKEDFQMLSELTMPELIRPEAPDKEDEAPSAAAEDSPAENDETPSTEAVFFPAEDDKTPSAEAEESPTEDDEIPSAEADPSVPEE